MHFPSNRLRPKLSALLAIALLVALTDAECAEPEAKYPGDRELVELLAAHQPIFDELAEMATEDSETMSFMISSDSCSAGLSKSSQDQFRHLLSQIKADLVLRVDASLISFSYWGGGNFVSVGRSWSKGLAIFPHGVRKDAQIVPGLDTRPTNDGIYIVPIDQKWFIIYVQVE